MKCQFENFFSETVWDHLWKERWQRRSIYKNGREIRGRVVEEPPDRIARVLQVSWQVWSPLPSRGKSSFSRIDYNIDLFLKFDFTSTPWMEDSSPLVETLKAMVSALIMKSSNMADGARGRDEDRNLSLEQRIDKIRRPLKKKTKWVI